MHTKQKIRNTAQHSPDFVSKRNRRKNRPKLNAGDTQVKGTVVRFISSQNLGFIQPDNGAARIHFSMEDVPYNRMRCVGEGSVVYFDVSQGKPIKRKRNKKVIQTLTAKIRLTKQD